jgi:hypothetical protein
MADTFENLRVWSSWDDHVRDVIVNARKEAGLSIEDAVAVTQNFRYIVGLPGNEEPQPTITYQQEQGDAPLPTTFWKRLELEEKREKGI